ncbi:receptor-like protein 4 isoform X2 [Tasmannia lanceolata]|uniref:receptor-like protein 4 isoform X2 n=1 Tax=Tasmannia lanceolata TaxID=3420 RepID=UPI004064619C
MFKHSVFLLPLFLQVLHSAAVAQKKEPFALRISCGAREDVRTDPTNTLWFKDFAYTGGRPGNASLTNRIVPPLKTLRFFPLSDGPENCYTINRVPSGHYWVRVFFALVEGSNLENEPLFDISVEGTQVYSLKSGWTSSDELPFAEALVFVTDHSVLVCFHSTGHGDPSILSIEILQVDENAYKSGPQWGKGTILRTAKRLTCGSGKPAFDEDYSGNHWGGDRFWSGIQTLGQGYDKHKSVENTIKRVSIPPNFYPEKLYQSAIFSTDSQPDLSFSMEVDPNKNYSIWLHFAEIESGITSVGQRVFDILINGDIAFKNVDIIHNTGDRYSALVLNKTVVVSGRTLTVTMKPMKGSRAIVNAIEVFEVIVTESITSPEEVRALQTLKNSLGLPVRFGWNGDPCVPQQHPWSGVDCQFSRNSGKWVIDGLNLSGNSIYGAIPFSLGTISGLETLDLSYNFLNGSIPESLGQLTSLRRLDLNGNFLSGRVPVTLGGRPLHRASFNFTGNAGLCGVPGLRSCGPHLSTGSKIGIALGALGALILIVICSTCWWKRRQNILRAQNPTAREAHYAKARTHFVRDVQMTRPRVHDQSRPLADDEPRLLS